MNQLNTISLDELLHHKGWLVEQLAEHARAYLTTLERLGTLEPTSDAHATLEGRLYAQAAQLMTAGDVKRTRTDALIKALDAKLTARPALRLGEDGED